VIKVLNKGQLTLDEDVDVEGATGMQKAIVVDGSESSVTLKGKLTGFEGMKVKMSNRRILLSNEQINYTSNNNTNFIEIDEKHYINTSTRILTNSILIL
ncbi:hypothetical protein, partial [Bartonella bovis]|uniref:hypothetical protein n=1 Tax=Bartonella bovis TaxID=155194 RepID=UPI001AEC4E5E